MILRKDEGVTEVVGFTFVIIIAIFAMVTWLIIATPIYATNDEIQHNTAVEFEFADLKNDIDTICISNAFGIKRGKVINLAPTSDKSKITSLPDFKTLQSYGTITIKKGEYLGEYSYTSGIDRFYNLNIVYTTYNMYAPDITIIYDGGSIKTKIGDSEYSVLNSMDYKVVVAESDFKEMTIGSNEAVLIEYHISDKTNKGDYIINIGMG